MKTEYFVYDDRMKVSGPFAHIKTVHTPEKGDYMEGTQ
jgi:hypothetical protein